jgi:hypothetical protein
MRNITLDIYKKAHGAQPHMTEDRMAGACAVNHFVTVCHCVPYCMVDPRLFFFCPPFPSPKKTHISSLLIKIFAFAQFSLLFFFLFPVNAELHSLSPVLGKWIAKIPERTLHTHQVCFLTPPSCFFFFFN